MNDTAISPLRHLYFFDDLSYHLKRIAAEQNIDERKTEKVLSDVWDLILEAMKCLDHRKVDFNLFNWDHACAQLADELNTDRKFYDIIVSQGCNGEYALANLNATYIRSFNEDLSAHCVNVRLAHILDDPTDPFYSSFKIGCSRGAPLDDQIAVATDLAREIAKVRNSSVRIAVFDDCIQTGEGTKYVAEKIRQQLGNDIGYSLDLIGFIGCEAVMRRFRASGYDTHIGVLLRGKAYPEAWAWDVYFLKDQIITSAVRFADGTSVPYMAGGWYDKIFAGNPARATEVFHQIHEVLSGSGFQQHLEAM